jgi:ubiquinol-cytochrome c reductase iron-sulfur subunit
VAAVGAVGILTPFVGSWNPSAKAKAAGAPVKADISQIEPGQMVVVEWRGQPVYVVNRTVSQLEALAGLNGQLSDPESQNDAQQPAYISGIERSSIPNLLVVVGLCTHLGCAPKYVPEVGVADMGGAAWVGGFFCPCHGSKFDLSGRVYAGVPAPSNLLVPPYSFEGDKVLVVGVNPENV